ncbi:TraB/GumN family protein [Massilia sp. LXY-6]|uniref:TraB/GumN family protein n=1 Tax=Massilia sp. LXY-6 TaxID=3379823 RepID=UPI003EE10A04
MKPSYAVAEVAVMETYFGLDQLRNGSFALGAPCFDDPKGLHTQRLHLAFDALIKATRDSHLDVPNWLESWALVPEYLTSTSLDVFTTASLGPAYDVANEGGVSFRLRGKGTTSKKTIGLDTLSDRRTQFCSASAADRADFVADKALQVSRLLRLQQSDPLYVSRGKLAVAAGEVTDETVRCVDRPVPCAIDPVSPGDQILQDKGLKTNLSLGTFEIMIKQRTHAWVPLIAKTISEHHRTFVIVGALHLPDLRVGNRVEPGLISLLRRQGFSVTSIGGASDISATFLSPSWFDRVRSALGSL